MARPRPGTAFVELALQVGQAGGQRIEEAEPAGAAGLSGQGSMRIQVSLAPADVAGARVISITSAPRARARKLSGSGR